VRRIAEGDDAFVLINYANPDMVGHTGVFEAAVRACETVDACLGRLEAATLARGGVLLVLADHGNAETMLTPDGATHTAHTTNPVPCLLVGGPRGCRAARRRRPRRRGPDGPRPARPRSARR
jgi:2,3-bisphosphoglycerate-independent phosphoglycerate mutase